MTLGHSPSPDTSAGDALWAACLEQLAQDIPEQQINTWIRPLGVGFAADLGKVTLTVANRFKMDWVRAQYASRIAATLETIHGAPVLIELALTPRENIAKS